jgi:RNA polymerase sigma-70 factor, ECF subfamily
MNVPTDDARLMQAAAAGDRHAFAELFDRHQARVVRFCHRYVGEWAHAEELAQDVFVKLFTSAKRYQPTASFTTFLFRVATNHCLNATRNKGIERTETSMAKPDDGDASPLTTTPGGLTPDAALEGKQLELRIGRAMRAMSDRERAAFTMCRFEGLSYRDIALAMEATEAAVKSLIHRATLQVAKQLEEGALA